MNKRSFYLKHTKLLTIQLSRLSRTEPWGTVMSSSINSSIMSFSRPEAMVKDGN